MQGLTFEVEERVAPSAPERADVACFVGYARRRPGGAGWGGAAGGRGGGRGGAALPRSPRDAGGPHPPKRGGAPVARGAPPGAPPPPWGWLGPSARHFAWEARSAEAEDGATY